MIFLGAILAIAVTMSLALVRALLGPSVYDRVLAVNMFGTKTVLLLSCMAFVAGRSDYLDLALAYALINFIGVLAVLEFFRQRERATETPEGHIRHPKPATAHAHAHADTDPATDAASGASEAAGDSEPGA